MFLNVGDGTGAGNGNSDIFFIIAYKYLLIELVYLWKDKLIIYF